MDYINSRNTYFAKPKDDPKDRIEIEIGDSKENDFYPQLKISRWDNEANFSVRLKHSEINPKVSKSGEKIKWKGDKIDAELYKLENGHEFEIILKEKPTTNKIEFTIQDKDVEYFYQPELTQEEKDSGAIRPENVIGSYAVYAKSNKVNYVGGKEYKCGKIGHIYRPKIIDSAGTEVWGDLNIENGIMSVAIPQDFLDNAVYPVRHAAGATFGYTSIGGDSGSIFSGTIGTKFTGSAGTLTSISVYNERGHNRDNKIKCALFKVSDNSFVTNSGSSEETGEQIPGWDNLSVALTPTITAIDYFVTAMIGPYNVPTDAVRLYYDSGDTGQTWEEQMVYGPWPATIFNEFEVDRKYSIYCTYTASGPTYTLTTEVGTFTLSGKATVLKVSRKMVASVGTFALTGIAASLKVARKLTASVGTFNLTGIAAGLFKGYVLVASVGVFTLTGVSAGLKIARKLTASVGTFTLTGINTGLKIARKLTATTGVFVLTGIDVVLTYTAISIVARKFIRSKRKSLQHYIRKPR